MIIYKLIFILIMKRNVGDNDLWENKSPFLLEYASSEENDI
jgi:hypothetical protein